MPEAGRPRQVLLCDDSADAEFCAADLLGQAEHGYNSPAVFVTTSERLTETLARVQAELEIIPTKGRRVWRGRTTAR